MVKNKFLLFGALVCAGLFSACSNEESLEDMTSSGDGKAICEVQPLVDDSDDSEHTRASMEMGTSGMDFIWAKDDPITVYTGEENDALTKQTYPMKIDNMPDGTQGNVAWFEPAGFELKSGYRYFCLGNAYDPGNPTTGVTSSISRNSIEVSYAGQRQTANGSTAHLAKYCFLAASDICNNVGHVHFTFQHLGLTLRLVIKGLPAGVEYTNLEMYDGDDFFRQPARRLNLMAGLNKKTEAYAPAFEPLDMSLPANKTAPRFSVALGADAEHGISVTASQSLVVYMEIPPVDLSGKTITFQLKSKSGTQDMYCTYKDGTNNGRAFKAGTAVQMTMNVKKSKMLPITLVLHRDWDKFTSVNQTRAIGDPGTDEFFREPTTLHYYLCVDGKVKVTGTRSKITWVNNRYAFDPFSISEENPQVNFYVIASASTVTLLPSIAVNASEELVKDVYAEIAADADLRDVYSTPYTATNFVGEVKGVDIPLYHVASKLDVQWNAASPISNVSVGGLPTTIKLFQPTTHSGTGTGSRTLTTNEGNKYFGRAVFYVPQMANGTYSITTGSDTRNVQFSPNVSDGITSWMKANITQ